MVREIESVVGAVVVYLLVGVGVAGERVLGGVGAMHAKDRVI